MIVSQKFEDVVLTLPPGAYINSVIPTATNMSTDLQTLVGRMIDGGYRGTLLDVRGSYAVESINFVSGRFYRFEGTFSAPPLFIPQYSYESLGLVGVTPYCSVGQAAENGAPHMIGAADIPGDGGVLLQSVRFSGTIYEMTGAQATHFARLEKDGFVDNADYQFHAPQRSMIQRVDDRRYMSFWSNAPLPKNVVFMNITLGENDRLASTEIWTSITPAPTYPEIIFPPCDQPMDNQVHSVTRLFSYIDTRVIGTQGGSSPTSLYPTYGFAIALNASRSVLDDSGDEIEVLLKGGAVPISGPTDGGGTWCYAPPHPTIDAPGQHSPVLIPLYPVPVPELGQARNRLVSAVERLSIVSEVIENIKDELENEDITFPCRITPTGGTLNITADPLKVDQMPQIDVNIKQCGGSDISTLPVDVDISSAQISVQTSDIVAALYAIVKKLAVRIPD
jgi:hypothetical protein